MKKLFFSFALVSMCFYSLNGQTLDTSKQTTIRSLKIRICL